MLKVSLELAKRALDEAYLQAEADFINGKISNIASLHISKQHHAAWNIISEISGKRSKTTVRLKGGSQSKRLANWTKGVGPLKNQSLPKISNDQEFSVTIDLFL